MQSQRLQNNTLKYMLSDNFLQLETAYNLTAKDIILCFAVAAGAPASDALQIICNKKGSQNKITKDLEVWHQNNPGAAVLINRIKNRRGLKPTKEEITRDESEERKEEKRREYKNRDGIINKLIDAVDGTTGKETISGLQTIAKLQGLDKPEEHEKEDKRTYFLPFVSCCRSCQLMKIYRDTEKALNKGI